jgi:hypothetical protein
MQAFTKLFRSIKSAAIHFSIAVGNEIKYYAQRALKIIVYKHLDPFYDIISHQI